MRFDENYGFTFDVEPVVEQSMSMLEDFSPPDGRLLLASEETRAAGMAWLYKIGDGMGEPAAIMQIRRLPKSWSPILRS